jgi:hypothetical protein
MEFWRPWMKMTMKRKRRMNIWMKKEKTLKGVVSSE